jgi:hypothetical protein
MAGAALLGIALVLLAAACGGGRPVEKKPGVLVVILDPVRPDALDALSMPLEVTVRHQPGDLVGNYPLSHVDDPLVLLIRPGRYSIKISAGCAGRFMVPAQGQLTSGDLERIRVSFYYRGGKCHLRE